MFESPKLYNESGFKKEEDAKEFVSSLAGKKATISELKKSKQKENAPLLFNLAEIQNKCTKLFNKKYGTNFKNKIKKKKVYIYDGRVMTCVLGMVLEQEREIKNFVKTKYYKVLRRIWRRKFIFYGRMEGKRKI